MQLTTDQWIQIISSGITAIASVLSITIATIAVRQTSAAAKRAEKASFLASRPYISIYCDAIPAPATSFDKLLVIKNFGQTPAIIQSITSNGQIDEDPQGKDLKSLHNFTLAPGMSIQADTKGSRDDQISFKVRYSDTDGNRFSESFDVNFGFMNSVSRLEHHTSKVSDDTDAIVSELHHITRQLRN